MSKKIKIASIFLATSLIITPISNVVLQNHNVAKAEEIKNYSQNDGIDIKKLDKYVKLNKEKGLFEFERSDELSVDEITFLETKINQTNKTISNLIIGENEQIKYLSNKVKVLSMPKLENGISFRYAEGIDAIDFYWWGMDVWLSRTTLNRSLSTGALIAGVLIPPTTIAAALTILMGAAGIWEVIPGGIYMKVNYPFSIAEVRWHG